MVRYGLLGRPRSINAIHLGSRLTQSVTALPALILPLRCFSEAVGLGGGMALSHAFRLWTYAGDLCRSSGEGRRCELGLVMPDAVSYGVNTKDGILYLLASFSY